MLSRRFSCPAVSECTYDPREVPYAAKDMKNTVLFRPARNEWLELLGEMVQITNEAVRRRASTARDASKPLCLEYMADRIDVDDPLFGYVAVTKDKGWLQGCVPQPTERRCRPSHSVSSSLCVCVSAAQVRHVHDVHHVASQLPLGLPQSVS